MRRSNATTLQDVAREAGVATMTVSVVLNGSRSATRVSEGTRARIVEAAQRLRYRPNAAARGLTRSRMDAIGLVAIIDSGDTNLYFLEVLNGILLGGAQNGQNTTVFTVDDWAQDEQKILNFCDGRIDGLVFVGPNLTAAFAETLHHYTPFVTIHNNGELPRTYNLDVDNTAGAFMMVKHLIDLGHRRIAHITGLRGKSGAEQRLDGYRKALASAGILVDESLVLNGHFTVGSGAEETRKLIDFGRPLPTAIFCANDATAFGCMEALAGHGIRVPHDISVAGFDDLITARMASVPLTTVRQPFRQMGIRSVELLMKQISAETSAAPARDSLDAASRTTDPVPGRLDSPHTEIVDCELVIRDSVAPPRATAEVLSIAY